MSNSWNPARNSGTNNYPPNMIQPRKKNPYAFNDQYPPITKQTCEYLRNLAKQRFYRTMPLWMELGRWGAPHRIKFMQGMGMTEGYRNNAHIVDNTHVLALRSFVAGFLEGNTSASRPWARWTTGNEEVDDQSENLRWLQIYTKRCMNVLANSNFYYSASQFYGDYGVFNTGAHYLQERKAGPYWHTLVPGSYFVINNGLNEAVTLVRELSLTVKAIVEQYGRKNPDGSYSWDNISWNVRKMYEQANYTTQWTIVEVCTANTNFDPSQKQVGFNQPWLCVAYELGGTGGQNYQYATEFSDLLADTKERQKWLRAYATRRKPFIVGKSDSGMNFEYGETGPTLNALGLIKSINKKTIAEDQAIEQMLRPALQGPANLRKSYITTAPNSYVPVDPNSYSQGKGQALRSIFEINPAFPALTQNKEDLRQQISKLYYADYLMYLTQNPKTRTAEETQQVVKEQQLVIGPMLQSLNQTYNIPVIEWVADYVLWDDPWMKQFPVPPSLQGQFLRPEFISVFAQAQRAADLPAVDQYLGMVERVAQLNPSIWDKANLDKIADVYQDRLFLPEGINRPQEEVDAKRQQAQMQQMRQQMLEQTLPAVAKAGKDAAAAQPQQAPSGGGIPQ